VNYTKECNIFFYQIRFYRPHYFFYSEHTYQVRATYQICDRQIPCSEWIYISGDLLTSQFTPAVQRIPCNLQ